MRLSLRLLWLGGAIGMVYPNTVIARNEVTKQSRLYIQIATPFISFAPRNDRFCVLSSIKADAMIEGLVKTKKHQRMMFFCW